MPQFHYRCKRVTNYKKMSSNQSSVGGRGQSDQNENHIEPSAATTNDLLASITCAFELTASGSELTDGETNYESISSVRRHVLEASPSSSLPVSMNHVFAPSEASPGHVASLLYPSVYNNNYYASPHEYSSQSCATETTWSGGETDSTESNPIGVVNAVNSFHGQLSHMNYGESVTDLSHPSSSSFTAYPGPYYGGDGHHHPYDQSSGPLCGTYWPPSPLVHPQLANSPLQSGLLAPAKVSATRRGQSKRSSDSTSPGKVKRPSKSTPERQVDLEQKFAVTVEFLKSCNLYDITMATADIIRRNCQLQEQIDALRDETANVTLSYRNKL